MNNNTNIDLTPAVGCLKTRLNQLENTIKWHKEKKVETAEFEKEAHSIRSAISVLKFQSAVEELSPEDLSAMEASMKELAEEEKETSEKTEDE